MLSKSSLGYELIPLAWAEQKTSSKPGKTLCGIDSNSPTPQVPWPEDAEGFALWLISSGAGLAAGALPGCTASRCSSLTFCFVELAIQGNSVCENTVISLVKQQVFTHAQIHCNTDQNF